MIKTIFLVSILLFTSATEASDRKVKPISKSAYKQMLKAQELIEEGDVRGGVELLQKHLTKKRLNANEESQLWNLVAYGYYKAEDNPKTIAAYKEVVRVGREGVITEALEINSLRAIFQLLYAEEDYENALKYMKDWEWVVGDNKDPSVHYLRATAHYQLGSFDDALASAQKIEFLSEAAGIEFAENHAYLLAVLYLEMGQTENYIRSLQRVIDQWPAENYYSQLYSFYLTGDDYSGRRSDLLREYRNSYGDAATNNFLASFPSLDEDSEFAQGYEITSLQDTEPPRISMSRGISVVSAAKQVVSGQAFDTSGVAIVEVNGREASLDSDGNFSAEILLAPGKNDIQVTALDIFSNVSIKKFSIERKVSGQVAITPNIPDEKLVSNTKFHALLIGVDQYADDSLVDLDQPINDAMSLGEILVGNYAFDQENISFLQNPNRDQILDALDRYTNTLGETDNLLIFYAGHGFWDSQTDQGYWLPADAESDRRRDWISNGTLVDYINGIKTQHTLLIADACFSGGIFKSRSIENAELRSSQVLHNIPSRKAITSGRLNEVPDQSVFVEYLLKYLALNEREAVTSRQLFSEFRTAVINNSPTNQVPQFGEVRGTGDEGGDFIFLRKKEI
jgi:tetratricopeptide (TPR) repeat protein